MSLPHPEARRSSSGTTALGVLASFLDQAVLSAVSFTIGVLFIATDSRSEFAVYTLALTGIQLASSVQNALIITPMMANTPHLDKPDRASFVTSMVRIGSRIAIAASLVFTAGVFGVATFAAYEVGWVALAGGLALLGMWSRELRRARQFLDLRPWRVLAGDAIYASLSIGVVLVALLEHRSISAGLALAGCGAAGLLTGLFKPLATGADSDRNKAISNRAKKLMRQQVKWTLPSVAVSWLQSSSYTFFAGSTGGLKSIADLNAARLAVTPVSLLLAAWNRLYLPTAGRLIGSGRRAEAVRMAMTGAGIFAIGCAAYGSMLLLAYQFDWLPGVRQKLHGLEVLVAMWLGYMIVSGIRGVGTQLLVAETAFEVLFRYGVIALTITLVCVPLGGTYFGNSGILIGLAVGELALACLIWGRILADSSPGA